MSSLTLLECLVEGDLSHFSKEFLNRTLDEKGLTPLLLSAYIGQLRSLKHLISLGVDIECTDVYGNSALHLASAQGNGEVVRFLLTHADLNVLAEDIDGHLAADLAHINGHQHVASLINGFVERIDADVLDALKIRAQRQRRILRRRFEAFQRSLKSNNSSVNSIYRIANTNYSRSDYTNKSTERSTNNWFLNPSNNNYFSNTSRRPKEGNSGIIDSTDKNSESNMGKFNLFNTLNNGNSSRLSDPVINDDTNVTLLATNNNTATLSATNKRSKSNNKEKRSSSGGSSSGSSRTKSFEQVHMLNTKTEVKNDTKKTLKEKSLEPKRSSSIVIGSLFERPGLGTISLRSKWCRDKEQVDSDQMSSNEDCDEKDEVATFLECLNLSDYWQSFRKERIDLEALLLLDENDLRLMNIEIGPRKKMVRAIEKRRKLQTANFTATCLLKDSKI